MRVVITKDMFDGTKSKGKELYLEGASMSDLIFMLMTGDVAGLTITKADVLQGLKHMEKDNET